MCIKENLPKASDYNKVGSILPVLSGLVLITIIIFAGIQLASKKQVPKTSLPQISEEDSMPETSDEIPPSTKEDQTKIETERWSDTRKTLWERTDYGLRVTAPEWIEKRYVVKTNEDGSVEYSEWERIYPEADYGNVRYGNTETEGIYIKGFYSGGGPAIYLIDSKYTGKTFTDVINNALLGAGACMSEWSSSVSECKSPTYCYTKNEVIENLVLRKTAEFGPYPAQLRGINTAFSSKQDCRGEDIWLIQAKGGQFVLSEMDSDGGKFRLEGF